MPKASCSYVFDLCALLIFHFSQLSGAFLAQKKHTCFQKLFLTSKNSCKEYFVERKQIKSTTAAVWRRKMSCLHPVRTRFFFRCTRLDATDGNGPCQVAKLKVTQPPAIIDPTTVFHNLLVTRISWYKSMHTVGKRTHLHWYTCQV